MSLAARQGGELAGAPTAARHSIQHAFAAAEVYTWLRFVGLSMATSSTMTRRLGHLNEWVERVVKWPGDTTREVYKDLANNQLGIVAASAIETCQPRLRRQDRLIVIGRLPVIAY